MSVKAMSWVFDHSPYTLGTRLVHLVLADQANDAHDNRLWLKQSEIAGRARMSVAQVARALRQMVADGYLVLVEQGAGRGRPSVYELVMKAPQSDVVFVGENPSSMDGNPIISDAQNPSSVDPDLLLTQIEPKDPNARVVDDLCDQLADAIARYRDDPAKRPASRTARWREDMDLLVHQGPLHRAVREPQSPQRIREVIDLVFRELATVDRRGFCWAKNIRSPGALRDHWDQLIETAKCHIEAAHRPRDVRRGRPGETYRSKQASFLQHQIREGRLELNEKNQ